MSTYTYKDFVDQTKTVTGSTDGIDFARGTRAVCKEATKDSTLGKDMLFATDSVTFMTGGKEYGAYYPDLSIIDASAKTIATVGGIASDTNVSNYANGVKTISLVLDDILFPEGAASNSGSDTKGQIKVSINSEDVTSGSIEVGSIIPTSSVTAPTTSKSCKYVKNATTGAYETYTYTVSNNTVTVSVKNSTAATVTEGATSTFTTYTYSTASTLDVTGPSSAVLTNGHLYLSRGSDSGKTPTADATIGYNGATVKTYYKMSTTGMLTNSDYKYFSDSTYSDSSFIFLNDLATAKYTAIKSCTVQKYTNTKPTVTAKIYVAGLSTLNDYTTYNDLNSSYYTISDGVATVLKDAAGKEYTVYTFTVSLTNKAVTDYAKGAALYINVSL